MSTIALVQKAGGEQAGGTQMVQAINATGANNLLVVFAYSSGSTAINKPDLPSSASWVQGNNRGGMPTSSKNCRIMWLPNVGAGITSVSWTPTSGAANAGLYVYEYSGANIITPLDVQTTGTVNAGTTTPTDSALTPTHAGSAIFTGSCTSVGGDSWSLGAGFADLISGGLGFSATEDITNISTQKTATFTIAPSDEWAIISAIFQPQLAPIITSQPVGVTINEGQTASFSVTASSSGGALSYQWQTSTNGGSTWGDIGGATSSSYTTPALVFSNSGTFYRVNVTDSNGTTTSNGVSVLVLIDAKLPWIKA